MSTPTRARQEPEGRNVSTPRSSRGPYRRNGWTPRQTMHNRKRRKLMETSTDGSAAENFQQPLDIATDVDVAAAGNFQHPLETADNENTCQNVSDTSDDVGLPTLNDSLGLFACEAKKDDKTHSSLQPESLPNIHVPKLFPGSVLSLTMSHLLISSYMCRHHLSTQAQEDLLQLLQLHIPVDNLLPTSLYAFRKMSSSSDTVNLEPVYHSYCQRCYTVVSDSTTTCPNPSCAASMCVQSTPSFITVSIAEQLKILFERPGFYSSLQWQKNIMIKPGQLADIYGGQLYQALACAGGCLADNRNISVVLNTDGVVVFQSTSLSIWPVLLMINELPFPQRKQPKNMILAGLWCSTEKPPMQMFLKPITEMLSKLESEGIQVHPPGIQEPFNMKVQVISCTCDLPARAMVQNFIQFNGFYGCCYCEQPGKTTETDNGGHVHTFPYIRDSPKGPERTKQACMQYAVEAVAQHTVVTGVKGPSWLCCLNSFDFIKGVSPEYMHCALLGVSKLLLNLWMDADQCCTRNGLRADIPVLDKRISQIEVPSEIRRKPRGISDLKHWKASEYRSWTLFYAIPVLRGVLSDKYFQHFLLFSEALWLLLQSTPSLEDVAMAERLLQHFCMKFAAYYGERYYTANVHHLLHFADSVRNLGPLWAHSAFPFEDTNGWLGDLFHGSRDPQKQIVKAFTERQKLSAAAERVLESTDKGSEAKGFLTRMLCTGHRYTITADVGQAHLVLGKLATSNELVEAEAIAVRNAFPCANLEDCIVYSRILISGVMYTSSSYKRSTTTNDHTVCLKQGQQKLFGSALKYLSFCTYNCTKCSTFCTHVIVVNNYSVVPHLISSDTITGATARHIHCISYPSGIRAFRTSEIHTKCVVIKTDGNESYVAELPNLEEKDL